MPHLHPEERADSPPSSRCRLITPCFRGLLDMPAFETFTIINKPETNTSCGGYCPSQCSRALPCQAPVGQQS